MRSFSVGILYALHIVLVSCNFKTVFIHSCIMISLAQLITECIQLFRERLSKVIVVRESSFNMARRGDEDVEGWLRKFLAT